MLLDLGLVDEKVVVCHASMEKIEADLVNIPVLLVCEKILKLASNWQLNSLPCETVSFQVKVSVFKVNLFLQ